MPNEDLMEGVNAGRKTIPFARFDKKSTLITSQLPVDAWHRHLDDPTLADAILDRLVHNAYKIELKGDSMRKKKTA